MYSVNLIIYYEIFPIYIPQIYKLEYYANVKHPLN